MKTKEVLETLEELKKSSTKLTICNSFTNAINTVENNDSFLSWLMSLDSNKFDNKEKMLNKIQLKLLLGEKGE